MKSPLDKFSERLLAEHLEARGYSVTKRSAFKWERPCEFSRRYKKHPTYFSKRLGMIPGPPNFEAERGKTGRTIRLRSNPELELWMQGR